MHSAGQLHRSFAARDAAQDDKVEEPLDTLLRRSIS